MEQNNQHLTYLKVENFKKFDSLEVSDIGQFNLIVGDNNVGKTCLLEALLFDENPKILISNFWLSLKKRGMVFQIKEITENIDGELSTKLLIPNGNYFLNHLFKISEKNLTFSYKIKYNDELYNIILKEPTSKETLEYSKSTTLNKFTTKAILPHIKINNTILNLYDYNKEYIILTPFISFNLDELYTELIQLWNLNEKADTINTIISNLQLIDINIENIIFKNEFKDLKNVFCFVLKNEENLVPLNDFGDGFKRIFYIVLKTISSQGKRLLIDEIDIGIHHSKQTEFIKNIFLICKTLDIQLFATTHSKETIEAFFEASKELEEKDLRLIRLQNKKESGVKAICYPYEYLKHIVESNTEER